MMVLPTRSRVGAASRLRGYEAVLLANIHSRWIDELGNVAHHDLSSSRDLESTRCTLRISDSLANATAEPLPFESANLLANGVLTLASRVPAVDRAVRFPADRDEGVPESVHLAAEDRGLAVAGAAGLSTTWFPEDLDPGPISVGSWLPYWQRRDEPRVHPASLCVRAEILAALGGWMAVSKKLRACPGLLLARNAVSTGHFIGEPSLLYRVWPGQPPPVASRKTSAPLSCDSSGCRRRSCLRAPEPRSSRTLARSRHPKCDRATGAARVVAAQPEPFGCAARCPRHLPGSTDVPIEAPSPRRRLDLLRDGRRHCPRPWRDRPALPTPHDRGRSRIQQGFSARRSATGTRDPNNRGGRRGLRPPAL